MRGPGASAPDRHPRLRTAWSCALGALSFALAGLLGACDANSWRTLFPSEHYDADPPELPEDLGRPAVLVFSKTNGYRHEEAIPAALESIRGNANLRGWSTFATESGAVFNAAQLGRFDVVVWNNATGDVLDGAQKEAFRAWLEAGGGFVGIHAAGGTRSYAWTWYRDRLVGARFVGHTMTPRLQEATIVVEEQDHPATRLLDPTWRWTEEWYSFERSPREAGVHVLARVDEASYSPRAFGILDLSMGDHPVMWWHCVGRGRAFYSALGHREEAYEAPTYRDVLDGAVAWAARAEGRGCD